MSITVGALTQTSFAAVKLTALTCASGSFAGPGTETCTVTLSGVVKSTAWVNLTTTSNAVNAPDDAFVQANQSSGVFTAPVASIQSVQNVTIKASYGGASKTFIVKVSPAGSSSPALTVSPTNLSFGSVALNTPTIKSFTVTSSGSGTLTLSGISASGAGFAVSGGSFPLTLNQGQAVALTVTFDPTTAGSFSGSVTIGSNAATATVSLSGTGQAAATPTLSSLSCASSSLSGAGTDACTVGLTAAATSATTVSLASSNSSVIVPASVTIPLGAASTSFTATAAAVSTNQTAALTATAGGVSKALTLTLNAMTRGLTLSSSSVAFGTQALNTSVTKNVTLTSSGTAALTISAAVLTGTGFGQAGMSLPLTLNPGQTATLTISFDPATAGSWIGSIVIGSNATGSGTATIALSGTGQAPATLNALSCTSGSLTGAGTDACTVTLTSAAASAITVALGSSNSAVTVPAAVTIAADATSAGFTATATAVSSSQTGTLTATAGSVSKTFVLTLNPATPTLTLSTSSVAFGSVQLNTPATQSVTITSSGSAAATLSAGTVSGAGFSLPGAKFPVTLNPGQTSTMQIQFDPTTAGAAAGAITLASNCSMGAMNVALRGTGAPTTSYEAELSWDAPANSKDAVVGYHVYRASGSGGYQLLNSSVNLPTTYTDTTVQDGATYNYQVKSVDATGIESAPSNVYTASIP